MTIRLTAREMMILRNIVEDHLQSEVETKADAGAKTAARILGKIKAAIAKETTA